MATSAQHTCCSCCCGQATTLQLSVWDRPIWSTCDVTVAFQISHTTLDSWRADVARQFPHPADLPGRSVRWWRDALLGWFQDRHELANDVHVDEVSDHHGHSPVDVHNNSAATPPHIGAEALPPVPRR